MKYWRGYLVAAIMAAFAIALKKFAEAHSALVDVFYPYVTRMGQSFLTNWSSGVDFCLWQVLLMILAVLILVSGVLMLVLRWNPIQWFGWVLTAVSAVFLLNTGFYGLNEYAGPLSEDIRLEEKDYTVTELRTAAEFFRDEAGKLSKQVGREENGDLKLPEFGTLAKQAGEGFQVLTREKFYPVFAGSTTPVKELGWPGRYTRKGELGHHAPLTGEASVNPEAPKVCLPFAMCQQMARRMCIAKDQDADFGAFLACIYNPNPEFRYVGYTMAYRWCMDSLEAVAKSTGDSDLLSIANSADPALARDVKTWDDFRGREKDLDGVTKLLVSWHIQEKVLPLQVEEEVKFDPKDESQVDLSGLVNAPTESEDE